MRNIGICELCSSIGSLTVSSVITYTRNTWRHCNNTSRVYRITSMMRLRSQNAFFNEPIFMYGSKLGIFDKTVFVQSNLSSMAIDYTPTPQSNYAIKLQIQTYWTNFGKVNELQLVKTIVDGLFVRLVFRLSF